MGEHSSPVRPGEKNLTWDQRSNRGVAFRRFAFSRSEPLGQVTDYPTALQVLRHKNTSFSFFWFGDIARYHQLACYAAARE